MDNLDIDAHINPQEDSYYPEYVRLYLANIALTAQVKELMIQKNSLTSRLSKYEDEEGFSGSEKNHEKNKRFRRTAHEIQRFYKCVVKDCEKSYGSEGSLNQHYKIKHPQIYLTLPNVQSSKYQHDQYSQSQEISNIKSNCPNIRIEEEHNKQNTNIFHHNANIEKCPQLDKKATSGDIKGQKRSSTRTRKSPNYQNFKQNYYY